MKRSRAGCEGGEVEKPIVFLAPLGGSRAKSNLQLSTGNSKL
jgi:hypothetical protein